MMMMMMMMRLDAAKRENGQNWLDKTNEPVFSLVLKRSDNNKNPN